MKTLKHEQIRKQVRERYGRLVDPANCGCGVSAISGCCTTGKGMAGTMGHHIGYSQEDMESVVDGANMGLGCGNPVVLGKLNPGETVLDLGCGGGFDCFLAAKAVGDSGKVIGVDMTAEMVSRARENANKMGTKNVEFRLGEIEHLPVADSMVDVILSNCVINLSPEKGQVFREVFRVLRPGGRLAISDVVATDTLPHDIQKQVELWTGCVAGAERIERLEAMLREIGFGDIHIRIRSQSRDWIQEWFPGSGVENYVASADIEAVKP